jgi:hypothetical protein
MKKNSQAAGSGSIGWKPNLWQKNHRNKRMMKDEANLLHLFFLFSKRLRISF